MPAWRGLTPLAMNPWCGQAPNQQFYEPQSDIAAIRWTHYDDLRNVYGVDATGAARPTRHNVGVQYGIKSLRAGRITMDGFVHLNWHMGGWKHPSDMAQEGLPFFGTSAPEINKALIQPGYFDPWSMRNMRLATADAPAPRTAGNPIAMRAAYTSGHVFTGRLDVPAIDHRQYMERELDMHNSHQFFAVRKRVLQRMSDSDNLVVSFTDHARHAQGQAVDPGARRERVWAGILDNRPAGTCTQAFPLCGTSPAEPMATRRQVRNRSNSPSASFRKEYATTPGPIRHAPTPGEAGAAAGTGAPAAVSRARS